MNPVLQQRVISVVSPAVLLVALYLGWELLIKVRDIKPLLLPAPSDILAEAWNTKSKLLEFVLHTAKESLVGIVGATVVSMVVGVLVYSSSILSNIGAAIAGAGRALPNVVLYPVVTVFLGTTSTAVEVIIGIALAPIMFSYILTGLTQKSDLDDLLHVVGGSRAQRFSMVRVPLALPYIVTGLRTSLPLAVISAVVGEYFGGSTSTLGAYIRLQAGQLHTVSLWAAVTFACLLGIAAFVIGALLEWSVSRRSGQATATT